MIKIDTLLNLSKNSKSAEDRGLLELIENNNSSDIAEMYGIDMLDQDVFTFNPDELLVSTENIHESQKVRMAIWSYDRLHNSDKVMAYAIREKGGLFVIYDENAEWVC